MTFQLPELSYDYDALEPHIDSLTMEIHHSKHHAGYTAKLNAAVKDTEMEGLSIEELLSNHSDNPSVRNNGGGFWNHRLFWTVMCPDGGGKPEGDLAKAIDDEFGSFEAFQESFANSAMTRFGSGWAWLCVEDDGKLCICSTPNQDNPLMNSQKNCVPILGLDVWEHAYYLNYQNRRPDYINAFFNVIDWSKVEDKFNNA